MHCPEANKSNALNLAINSLKENQLLFLTDDDVRFDDDVLEQYTKAAEGYVSGKVYGGTVKPDMPIPPPPELLPYIPTSMKGFPGPKSPMGPEEVFFIGSNWAVFSDDVKRLGGFDPLFGPGSKLRSTGQETQMMRKMRAAGFKFQFVDSAVVSHKVEPQHFTDEFVVDRRYRNGIEFGLRKKLGNEKLSTIDLIKLHTKAKLIPPLLPLFKLVCSRPFYLSLLIRIQLARGALKGWYAKV